jgi:cytochrome b561
MIPLGFCMQGIESHALKLLAFRLHVGLGISVLVLTLLRLVWRWLDGSPGPLPHLARLHLRGMEAAHALLYLVLAGLSISGVVLLVQSGLAAVLLGLSSAPIPADLSQHLPRQVHAIEARFYIALLAAHVCGVLLHQFTRGEVLSRMGIHVGQTAKRRASRNASTTPAQAGYQPDAEARRVLDAG